MPSSDSKGKYKDVRGDCPQQPLSTGELPKPMPDHLLKALQPLSFVKVFNAWDEAHAKV